jgi:hypothetical protein
MDALYLEMRQLYPNNEVQMTVVHPFTVNTGLAQNPISRFTWVFPISEAETVASTVIKAVKLNQFEVFVPERLFTFFAIGHLLPFKVKLALYDFAGCGVGAHDD